MKLFNFMKKTTIEPQDYTHKYVNAIGGEVKCYQIHDTFYYEGTVFGKRWKLKRGELLFRNENQVRIVLKTTDVSPLTK
jgi:hypothetical protein